MHRLKWLTWKTLYRKWRRLQPANATGYSLLVPVPADLPVFLELALSILQRQDVTHRVETLVIPDQPSPRCREIVQRVRGQWNGPLEVVELPWPDRWVTTYLNHPHHNHWLQLINGAAQARGGHAVLHDADLFMDTPELLRTQYEQCRDGGYACFGVNRVWDDWYEKNGMKITATWEMFFETNWLRSFPPCMHLGHEDVLNGERHTFDTTLYPQCRTEPRRIGWHTPPGGMIHFNYVICTYRYFAAARQPFADDNFRLLLIRILVELFDANGQYHLPSLDELTKGLTDPRARAHYTTPAARTNYPEYRRKFEELLNSSLLSLRQNELARKALQPFDLQFPWA